jgi:hypothetical protein
MMGGLFGGFVLLIIHLSPMVPDKVGWNEDGFGFRFKDPEEDLWLGWNEVDTLRDLGDSLFIYESSGFEHWFSRIDRPLKSQLLELLEEKVGKGPAEILRKRYPWVVEIEDHKAELEKYRPLELPEQWETIPWPGWLKTLPFVIFLGTVFVGVGFGAGHAIIFVFATALAALIRKRFPTYTGPSPVVRRIGFTDQALFLESGVPPRIWRFFIPWRKEFFEDLTMHMIRIKYPRGWTVKVPGRYREKIEKHLSTPSLIFQHEMLEEEPKDISIDIDHPLDPDRWIDHSTEMQQRMKVALAFMVLASSILIPGSIWPELMISAQVSVFVVLVFGSLFLWFFYKQWKVHDGTISFITTLRPKDTGKIIRDQLEKEGIIYKRKGLVPIPVLDHSEYFDEIELVEGGRGWIILRDTGYSVEVSIGPLNLEDIGSDRIPEGMEWVRAIVARLDAEVETRIAERKAFYEAEGLELDDEEYNEEDEAGEPRRIKWLYRLKTDQLGRHSITKDQYLWAKRFLKAKTKVTLAKEGEQFPRGQELYDEIELRPEPPKRPMKIIDLGTDVDLYSELVDRLDQEMIE